MAVVCGGKHAVKPNLLVILIDDLRFDETAASGHPYMKSPHIDRLAHEGAMFANAFHTTPLTTSGARR
jgi:arylsulfatase A-like enzyme